MAYYDVFNGDADGIFALLQLRKHYPLISHKITGVKRDIALLSRCDAKKDDSVTVLDISMEKNLTALNHLLSQNVKVFYVDHHRAGKLPKNDLLQAYIDLDANTCTSLIVDRYLNGQYHTWAIVAAFGDNLIEQANLLCKRAGFSKQQRDFLCELGTLVNYNGYGENVEDLHFAPDVLFDILLGYNSPFDLQKDVNSPYFLLKNAYEQDIAKAKNIEEFYTDSSLSVLLLPDEAFSRRLSGILSNQLANMAPNKAHLVLTLNKNQNYTVSLRAPLNNRQGADIICSSFVSGGGRAAAAGINQLPFEALDELIRKTSSFYGRSFH